MIVKILNEFFFLVLNCCSPKDRGKGLMCFHNFCYEMESFRGSDNEAWILEMSEHLLICFFFFSLSLKVKGKPPILYKELRSLLTALTTDIFIFL